MFLVKKHRVDEVYDSKVKAQNWEKLITEFNEMTEGMVGMPKSVACEMPFALAVAIDGQPYINFPFVSH